LVWLRRRGWLPRILPLRSPLRHWKKTVVAFPTRSPWRVAIGRALGHSGGGWCVFCVGEVGLM
jgi:hypothetical protein